MRSRTARLLPLPLLLLPLLLLACPPDATEGEGDATEGEGDVVVGEGEGDANEGEGDDGEGEGEGDVVGEGEGEEGPAALGAACVDNAGCGSGFCVDRVCCDVICDGGCFACSAALTGTINGACAPISEGIDPDDECDEQDGTCASGFCNGAGSCGLKGDGEVCRGSAAPCDGAEVCTSGFCPEDILAPPGTECRAADGDCDVAERCDGVSDTCPDDGVASSDTACRVAEQNSCDVDEFCDGTTKQCPADVIKQAGDFCRLPAGGCDVLELCDGLTSACPADEFLPAGAESDGCGNFICAGDTPSCTTVCSNDTVCTDRAFCSSGGASGNGVCIFGKLAFTTSTAVFGDFGGLAAGDALCQTLGQNANHRGTFKAWLSDSTTSAATRLTHATIPYVQANGGRLANNFTDLTDGSLGTAFNRNELGFQVASNIPFTGTSAAGASAAGAQNNCSNWTSQSGSGLSGFSESVVATWSANEPTACNVLHRLYCLQQ